MSLTVPEDNLTIVICRINLDRFYLADSTLLPWNLKIILIATTYNQILGKRLNSINLS